MTRLNLLLLIALIGSSLYLVQVSYDARRLFTAFDQAQATALELERDHERLQLEARAQATALRVEKVARDKLGMRTASPAVTRYVSAPAGLQGLAARPGASPSGTVVPSRSAPVASSPNLERQP